MVYPCPKHSSLFQVTKQSKRGTTQRFMWSRWGVGWRRNNWIQLHEHTVQYGASFSIWGHEWDLFAPQCFWKQTHCIGLGWGSWSKHCAFWLVWNIPKITATLGWRHSTRCIVHCCVLWRHSRCALHYRGTQQILQEFTRFYTLTTFWTFYCMLLCTQDIPDMCRHSRHRRLSWWHSRHTMHYCTWWHSRHCSRHHLYTEAFHNC